MWHPVQLKRTIRRPGWLPKRLESSFTVCPTALSNNATKDSNTQPNTYRPFLCLYKHLSAIFNELILHIHVLILSWEVSYFIFWSFLLSLFCVFFDTNMIFLNTLWIILLFLWRCQPVCQPLDRKKIQRLWRSKTKIFGQKHITWSFLVVYPNVVGSQPW